MNEPNEPNRDLLAALPFLVFVLATVIAWGVS